MASSYTNAALVPQSSEKEWPGVQRSIEEISVVQHRLHDEGFSQPAFFFGVANLGLTGFVMGHWPEHVWLLYVCKAVLYIPAWFREVSRRHNGALFVLDYCWVTNISLAVYMIVIFFKGPELPHEVRRYAFLWFFASALGPLAWACLVLHNGLIFHSIERTASLFIHFTPTGVAWTLRWYSDRVSQAWPHRFPTQSLEVGELGDLYLAGLVVYVGWLILHALWLLTIGVDAPSKGYETVFNDLYVKKNLASKFTSWFGCSGIRCHAAIYLALHGLACLFAFAWSLLCYHYFWVHTGFAAFMYFSAAWYGSGYYIFVFEGIYTRALGKLLPPDFQKKQEQEMGNLAQPSQP